MEIIGKTKNGFIIQATNNEVKEILEASTGKTVITSDLEIGQRMPAIDYAHTIRRIKNLGNSESVRNLRVKVKSFNEHFENLSKTIDSAANINL